MLHRVPYRLEVVGRVKLGTVGAPRPLLDHAIDRPFVGRHALRHYLADAHHTYHDTISTPSGGNLSYQPVFLRCSPISSTI
jgi:hypothetical protein